MKEKIESTKFTCDNKNCKDTFEGNHFPYELGWIYVFNANIQIPFEGGKSPLRKEFKDKHYSSKECYMQGMMNLVKQ